MKRFLLISVPVLLVLSILLICNVFKTEASTPYRIRMTDSGSTAVLKGIDGTVTEGDSLVGSYNSTLTMHEFDVTNSGFYTLWEDPLGGSSIARRTDWSAATGKYVEGSEIKKRLGVRFSRYYASLMDAVYDSGSAPVTGTVVGESGLHETLQDTTIYLTSGSHIVLPSSHKVTYKRQNVRGGCTYGLYKSYADTNITLQGGEYYGWADSNYVTGNVVSATNNTVTVDGLSVVADSLIGYVIHITAGTSTGHSRTVSDNAATAAGNTQLTLSSNWYANPDATSDYRITPSTQAHTGIHMHECHKVNITDVYMHDFAGDCICMVGGSDYTISNVFLYNPFHWYTTSTDSTVSNLVGRQGISLVIQREGSSYPDCDLFDTTVNPSGCLKRVNISNFSIVGGLPGGIDIEPTGAGPTLIKDVTISNGVIWGGYRGIAIENSQATFENILIENVVIKNIASYPMSLVFGADLAKNIRIKDVVFDSCNNQLYGANVNNVVFEGCTFSGLADSTKPYIGLSGTTNNVVFRDCIFDSPPQRAIYIAAGSHIWIEDCIIKDPCSMREDPGYDAIWITNADNVHITGCTIYASETGSTTRYPLYMENCDTVFVSGNRFFNLVNDEPYYDANSSFINEEDNIFGDDYSYLKSFSVELVSGLYPDSIIVDSLGVYRIRFFCSDACSVLYGAADTVFSSAVDTMVRAKNDSMMILFGSNTVSEDSVSIRRYLYGETLTIGESVSGDTTYAGSYPTSFYSINFPSYRDTRPTTLGGQIILRNFSTWGADPRNRSQASIFLFRVLGQHAKNYNTTDQRMALYKTGLMLREDGYINFSNDTTDVCHTSMGSGGYGIRMNSGMLEGKMNGGAWHRVALVDTLMSGSRKWLRIYFTTGEDTCYVPFYSASDTAGVW